MRRRDLTPGDRAAWANYAQLVAPLQSAKPDGPAPDAPPAVTVAKPSPKAAAEAVMVPAPRLQPKPSPTVALVVGTSPGGVDTGTWTRFRTGKLPAIRTLDLHGRTAQAAHAALQTFLLSAAADGVRCVEVITGRGRGESGGVIRREFPLWLNQPSLRPLVLGAAHPHALNAGSVRLLLRRPRR